MAVYTQLPKKNIETIVGLYTKSKVGDLLTFKEIIQGSENSNYFITTTKNKYVLTVFEDRVNLSSLNIIHELTSHLNTNGIKCPQFIKNDSGKYWGQINKKHYSLINFIEGENLKNIKQHHCYQVGYCLGKFHSLSAQIQNSYQSEYSWNKINDLWIKYQDLIHQKNPDIGKHIKTNLKFGFNDIPPNLPQGLCHGDLFPDNVLFINDKISGLLDFYFTSTDCFIFDLAITICAWCTNNNGKVNYQYFAEMLNGYNKIRNLNNNEMIYLPAALAAAALRFLLTRTIDKISQKIPSNNAHKPPEEFLLIFNNMCNMLKKN